MLDRIRQRPVFAVSVGAAVVVATVLALAAGFSALNYRDSIDDATRSASNLSSVMADGVDQAIATSERTLGGLIEAMRVGAVELYDEEGVERFIVARSSGSRAPIFSAVVILDRRGYVAHWTGAPDQRGRDLSHCAFFAAAVADRGGRTIVGRPERGCTEGRILIPFSGAILSPTGTVIGVAVALLDPALLLRAFRGLDIGSTGTASLWTNEGMLVARTAGDPAAIGQVFVDGLIFRGLRAGLREGTAPTVSPIDGIARLLSWRIVHDYPLAVSVAIGAPDYLARWRRETMLMGLVCAITVAIIVGLAMLFARQLGRAERAGRSLRESERRFRDFATASADWYWEQDEHHHLISATSSRPGLSAGDQPPFFALSRHVPGIFGVSEEQWRALEQDLAARRPLRNFTYQCIDSSGRLRHCSVSGVPVFDDDGEFRGYRGTGREITAEVEAGQTLRAVIDAIPGIINAKDVDGRYVMMNAFQAKLYGTTPERAIGKTAADLLGERYGSHTAAHDRRVVETGASTGFYEERYADADGVEHDWLTVKLPVKDPRGRVRFVISVSTEITERKQAEMKVLRAQEALLEAKEAAERANRAKSQFLANMSHELRTPLNAVIGFSEVMMNELFGPIGSTRYREYARDIHRSGSHLLDLINDILDMAKIEVGRRELSPEPVDLAAEIAETMRLIQWRVGSGVALETDLAEAPASAAFDRRALRQILLNLVGNAVKFTPAGGTVTLSVRCRPDGLALVIADTGIGIAEEHMAQLGTPFFQAHAADVAGKEGTGLGLALTKALVELHGGRMLIESTLGVGTTVTALFPAVPPPAERSRRSAA